MKKKKPNETASPGTAYNIANEQRGEQRNNIAQANETVMQSKQILNETNPLLNQYTQVNETGVTPYRQLLRNKLASTTADTGENQQAQIRSRAAESGFANSPLEFAARTAQGNEQAKRIADIPLQVEEAAFPREMQALGLQNQMQLGRGNLYNSLANTYNDIGRTYQPLGYFNTGVDIETGDRERKGNLFKNLLQAGSAFLPFA